MLALLFATVIAVILCRYPSYILAVKASSEYYGINEAPTVFALFHARFNRFILLTNAVCCQVIMNSATFTKVKVTLVGDHTGMFVIT